MHLRINFFQGALYRYSSVRDSFVFASQKIAARDNLFFSLPTGSLELFGALLLELSCNRIQARP